VKLKRRRIFDKNACMRVFKKRVKKGKE